MLNEKARLINAHIEAEVDNTVLVFTEPLFDWNRYLARQPETDAQAQDKANRIIQAISEKRDSFIDNYSFSMLKENRSTSDLQEAARFAMEQLELLCLILASSNGATSKSKLILLDIESKLPGLLAHELSDYSSIDAIVRGMLDYPLSMHHRLGDLHDEFASFEASIGLFNRMLSQLIQISA